MINEVGGSVSNTGKTLQHRIIANKDFQPSGRQPFHQITHTDVSVNARPTMLVMQARHWWVQN